MPWQRFGDPKSLCPLPEFPLPTATVPLQQLAEGLPRSTPAAAEAAASHGGPLQPSLTSILLSLMVVAQHREQLMQRQGGKNEHRGMEVPWSLGTRRLGSESRLHPFLLWNQMGLPP